jgi:guanylate kinase
MNIVFAISETARPGETSITERVCELIDGVELAIPCTTRPPRSAKDDAFVFTSREVFERMIMRQEFLEHALIFGNFYGTPYRCLQEARDNGNDLLVKVDVRGAAQLITILTICIARSHSQSLDDTGLDMLRICFWFSLRSMISEMRLRKSLPS